MATGRGWILKQQSLGFLRGPHGVRGTPARPLGSRGLPQPRDSPARESVVAEYSTVTDMPLSEIKEMHICRWRKKSSMKSNSVVGIDSLPSEVLLKILSYLDAVSLLCSSCVNKRFYHLSNDNMIWFKIYSRCFPPKRMEWNTESDQELAASSSLPDVGYWKKEYIMRKSGAAKAKIIQLLKPINTNTGLPLKTKEAIKCSRLRWMIVLKDRNGKEHVTDQSDISFNEMSVTVCWYSTQWPCLDTLSSLQLCGVTPILLGEGNAFLKNGPRHCSLLAEYELTNMTEHAKKIGCDKLVDLYCFDEGLMIGMWKESGIAFVIASLHYHQLIERSTLGSATMKHTVAPELAILDDIDPEYGMHGYQLHIDMHSRGNTYMCGIFRSLFCRKEYIRNGYLRFTVISFKNNSQHLPLVGIVRFPWRTDALEGSIQNCLIMDVTLLDDSQKPFWCFSAPVSLVFCSRPPDLCQYLGPSYFVKHVDSTGKVYMELVWMEEANEYFVVNLVLYLSTHKVNYWFGTNY